MTSTRFISILTFASLMPFAPMAEGREVPVPKDIKSYCLDFNWGEKWEFAKPGTWKDADPAASVAWHKTIGSNVIQTFCVSTNGYAWYKNGVVPEQPGLKHDFLREVVKLGHAEGMMDMGYFCIGANTRWGEENPELSYGTPSRYHIPYTDGYLAYLSSAITDAVKTTGIDGFMIDWVWQPERKSTQGKWIDAEKKLYQQLMGEPFPGEEKLTKEQDLAYSRKAIDRCWNTIHKAAKDANPECIIWLTTNKDGTINLDRILHKQLSELSGDSKNIAVLARAYRGKSIDSIWTGDGFAEAGPPPFRIEFRPRRGWSDTAHLTHEPGKSVITIRNPYQSGRARLTRVGDKWPSSIVIQLLRKNPDIAGPSHFRIANGNLGVWISQTGVTKVVAAKFEGALDLQNAWTAGKFLNGGNPESPITLKRVETKNTDEAVVIEVPRIIIESNPDTLVFEWCNGEKVR